MRLSILDRGHRLRERLRLRFLRFVMKREPPDVIKMILYRRDFFGHACSALLHDTMRGPSSWTVGERELFAAFVSRQNQCLFLTSSHGAVASIELGREVTDAVLTDWRTAPVGPALRAMLGFLARMAHTPYKLGARDAAELRAAGVSDAAAADAIQVAYCFHIIDRIADAVGFHVPGPEDFAANAPMLLKRGYKL